MSTHNKKVVIAGAGSVGCYIGGMLASGGANVHFLARPSMQAEIQQHGLHLSDHQGRHVDLTPDALNFTTSESVLSDADLILICVKSKDTHAMAEAIKSSGNTQATVFSCQNGVSNVAAIEAVIPNHTILPLMVPYNVVNQHEGRFHCGTQGKLLCQQDPSAEPLLQMAKNAQLGFDLKDDMHSVLWGKLLLNLNNPVNALSGIPLKQQLETPGYRKIYAACLKEGLAVLKAANITPAQAAAVPIETIIRIMSLPNFIFKLVAKKMLTIDPQARSSMWEDLENHRPVEVDYISGEIVKLGKRVNIPTPMNERLIRLVKHAEAAGQGSPNLSPKQILNG